MEFLKAEIPDLQEILNLQYMAYQSEAELLNDFSIPPLKETYDEVINEYNRGIILKAVDENNAIIGSVRGYTRDHTLYIGKLIVHPKEQNKGIGKKLLKQIEELFSDLRYELFTSSKSKKNLLLYQKAGYTPFKEEPVNSNFNFIYLEKLPQKESKP